MEDILTANMSLLKTKYTIPKTNKNLLYRQELINRLNESLFRKLTVITAPAGYGKTSTTVEWLELTNVPHAWISVDEGDNDVISFWRYLSAALDSVLPGIGMEAESVFASVESFRSNMHINILVDSLFDMGTDFVLVLDDLHLIKNLSVYDSLSSFINYMPSNMHVIVIGRTEPPMKLAKLGLKDELIRIQAKHLRFTKEEISQYLREKGYSLQDDELDIIESYTEGWVTALVAVAMSLRDGSSVRDAIRRLGDCNLQIEHYISEDILHMWSGQQQDFMEKTSVLDTLCAPLCEAITGYDASSMLQELYHQNTFLSLIDNDGIWFRYHHLFSDFLRKRLKNREASLISGLYQKAGEWLQANGHPDEAIEYFLRGELYNFAVPMIEKHGVHKLIHGEHFTVMSWIDRLPCKYIEQSPLILMFKAFCFAGLSDYTRAKEYNNKLSQLVKKSGNAYTDLYTAYLLVEANFHFIKGDTKNSMAAISEAASYGINNLIHINYVDFNLYDISMYRAIYFPIIRFLNENPGDFASFLSDYRKLISVYPGYAPLAKAEFHYESGNLSKSLPELATAIEEAMSSRCPGALVPAMVTMAKIKRTYSDMYGALETINQCEEIVATYNKPHWSYMLKAFKTRLYIDADNMELVNRWTKESNLSVYQELSRMREFELIVYARTLIKKQQYHDADVLLNRLLSFAKGLGRNHSIVEILNLLAITAMRLQDEEDAFLLINRSLKIGMEEGYVRSFVDELSPMISLLEMFIRRSSKRNKLTAYAKNIILQTQEAARGLCNLTDLSTMENLLTLAEKKVIQLIVKGYTNKEIADKLCITVRTASAHATNIYKKLGVKNRTQCVQKSTGASLAIN